MLTVHVSCWSFCPSEKSKKSFLCIMNLLCLSQHCLSVVVSQLSVLIVGTCWFRFSLRYCICLFLCFIDSVCLFFVFCVFLCIYLVCFEFCWYSTGASDCLKRLVSKMNYYVSSKIWNSTDSVTLPSRLCLCRGLLVCLHAWWL